MQGISPKQIKKIHALANRLGWSDEEYRKYLMRQSKGFVTSCKDLSEAEAEKIIRQMELLAAAKGVWEVRTEGWKSGRAEEREMQDSRFKIQDSKFKYEELAGREGMASPKQLRMIEAMWKDVSRAKTETERVKTLRNFIYRRWGVSDIRWLEKWQVSKVVKALKEMRI